MSGMMKPGMNKKDLAKFMKEKLSKTKVSDQAGFVSEPKKTFYVMGGGDYKKQNNFAKKKNGKQPDEKSTTSKASIYKPNLKKGTETQGVKPPLQKQGTGTSAVKSKPKTQSTTPGTSSSRRNSVTKGSFYKPDIPIPPKKISVTNYGNVKLPNEFKEEELKRPDVL